MILWTYLHFLLIFYFFCRKGGIILPLKDVTTTHTRIPTAGTHAEPDVELPNIRIY